MAWHIFIPYYYICYMICPAIASIRCPCQGMATTCFIYIVAFAYHYGRNPKTERASCNTNVNTMGHPTSLWSFMTTLNSLKLQHRANAEEKVQDFDSNLIHRKGNVKPFAAVYVLARHIKTHISDIGSSLSIHYNLPSNFCASWCAELSSAVTFAIAIAFSYQCLAAALSPILSYVCPRKSALRL